MCILLEVGRHCVNCKLHLFYSYNDLSDLSQ